ncbi:MAG: TonB-dependent receptor [Candidatus Marinimicrobia bacterium]|nr:TonB-dependent receptor [Candidatus Neomarinimicrobiota bacterium]
MKTLTGTLLILLLVVLLPITVFSQIDSTVTNTSNTTRVVLTEEDFIKHNCENVGDALKIITGVYVNAQGDIALRDVSTSKVVVIMDGQKLNVPGSIGVRVSSISIEKVAMIELLRGGRSAEYGADAVGGVIRITTRSKTESDSDTRAWSLGLKGSLGSYDRQIYMLNHSNTLNKFDYMLSYRRETWDGNFEYSDYPYEDYGQRITHANNHQSSYSTFAKIGTVLGEDGKLQFSSSTYVADNGTPGMSYRLTNDARLRFDNYTYNLNYDKQTLFAGFSLKAQAYYLNIRTRFDDPTGSVVEIHSDHKNYANGVDLSQAGSLGKNVDLSYGYSIRSDEINSTEVGNRVRDTQSAFLTASASGKLIAPLNQWEAVLALRYDAPSDFASEMSPRLSLSTGYQGKIKVGLTTHITRSYRAPSFNDLYWPRDAYAIGNPDLKSEYGLNYDIGLNINGPDMLVNISTSVNYFKNDVTDLILWAQNHPDGLWTPSNLSETSTTGIETSVNISALDNKIMTNVEYTYMEALNKTEDDQTVYNKYIIYRPKNKLDITSTLRLDKIELNFIYHWVGLRYTKPANTIWLPSYQLMDVNLTYRYNLKDLSGNATLELTNLTDEDFWRVWGTAEPGRMIKMSLGVNL